MIVSGTLRVLALSAVVQPPVTDFRQVVSKDHIARLLDGPLKAVSEQTRVILLHSVASMAERALGLDVRHIRLAAHRALQAAERRKVPGRQRSYDEYWDVAHELAPYMEPGDVHDRETALQARHAATLGIAIEGGLRRSELAGLKVDNVLIDRDTEVVQIVVPRDIRKDGPTIVKRLSPSISSLVIDYVDNARQYLLNRRSKDAKGYLWVSSEGGPLCAEGVINTLRDQVRRVLGVTACCILFRRANASRNDIMETETYMFLGHTMTSVIGQEVYAQKDIAQGQKKLINAWNSIAE
jgi:integrase